MSTKIQEALIKLGIEQQNVSEILEHVPQIITDFEHNYSVNDLKKVFETLIYIHIAQNIRDEGMWRDERNCPNRDILDRLVKFGLIDNSHWQNRSIQTTDAGEKLSNAIMERKINQTALKEMIESVPQIILGIIQNYQSLPIIYPNQSYVQNWVEFPQDFLLSLPGYNEKCYNLCKPFYIKAVKEGWACIAHSYVSTRGGEEGKEYYVLSAKIMDAIADVIPQRIPKELEQRVNEIKDKFCALKFLFHYSPDSYNGLGRYSQVEENIISYLKELTNSIDTSKDLFTSGFSSQMPFMIRDADAYKTKILKFEKELKQLMELFTETETKTSKTKVTTEKRTTKTLSKPQQETQEPPIQDPEIPLKSDLSILLGYDGNTEVYWFPKKENSWNFIVVGSAGTGKTQTVKAILMDFKNYNIPYLIFDFREDYCSENESQFGQVLDLDSISINPLEIEGKNSPKDQKYQISDIIDLIYNIGPKQIGFIRKSIKASYENKRIYENNPETWSNSPPTFNDIQNYLNTMSEEGTNPEKTAIQGIFSRLDPIFDYNVFSGIDPLAY